MAIPGVMRQEVLHRLHVGHLSVEKCFKRVREEIWWPGLKVDITNNIKRCDKCIKQENMRRQPLKNTDLPKKPWVQVGTDLFEFRGIPYLLIVDYFLRWIEVLELRDPTAREVIRKMKCVFSRLGIPEKIRSDNMALVIVQRNSRDLEKR